MIIVPSPDSHGRSDWYAFAANYGVNGGRVIDHGTIEQRFFTFRQFIEYARDHSEALLLQPGPMGFSLGFRTQSEADQFADDLDRLSRQYFEFRPKEWDDVYRWHKEVNPWIKERCEDGTFIRESDNKFLYDTIWQQHTETVRFLREDHASLFKMRWGDIAHSTNKLDK